MSIEFKIMASYQVIPDGGYIGPGVVKTFWKGVPKTLREAVGCYVFYRTAGRGHTPIYVGSASRSFKNEALHTHKLAYHYNPAVIKSQRGTYHILFITLNRKNKKDGTVRKLTAAQLAALEELEVDLRKL